MGNLTLNGAQRELNRLREQQVRRIGAETLRDWEAVVEWFSGNHSQGVRDRMMWQPGRSFGKLLPIPVEERPGAWPKLFERTMAWLVVGALKKGLSKEALKTRRYMQEVLTSCVYLIKEIDWPPVVELDVTSMDGSRFYRIDCHDHKEGYTLYPDGRVFKDKGYNPNIQNFEKEEVNPDILKELLERCI